MTENLTMTITPFYAGLLGLWFLVLTVRVMLGRAGAGKPSLGDGGDLGMQRRIRGHANFAEYTPLVLIMQAFLELNGLPSWVLHGIGGSLLVGRLLHGYAFSFTPEHVFGRSAGIVLTLLSLTIAAGLCVYVGVCGL